MISNYQYLNDKDLAELKAFNGEEDDIFENVEDWDEEAEMLPDT